MTKADGLVPPVCPGGPDDQQHAAVTPQPGSAPAAAQQAVSQIAIPVVAESLTVGKRIVETGKGIRVTKTVSEREEIVDESLERNDLRVERVAINQFLEASEIPSVRQEGDVTVVPILEEVLVTEKRLLLKEEVRITRVRREAHQPQRVMLRSEQVSVERFDDTDISGGDARRDV